MEKCCLIFRKKKPPIDIMKIKQFKGKIKHYVDWLQK